MSGGSLQLREYPLKRCGYRARNADVRANIGNRI